MIETTLCGRSTAEIGATMKTRPPLSVCFEWAGYLVPRDVLLPVHNGCRAHRTLCPTNTTRSDRIFWDIIIRWTGGGGVPSNERVDILAEEGRVNSPLYNVLSLLDRPVVSLEVPSTSTPQRAPAVLRSLELQDVINPSRGTPALCRIMPNRPTDQEISSVSKRLNFSKPMSPQACFDDNLSRHNFNLKSDTASSLESVSSRASSPQDTSSTISQCDSHSAISSGSSDTASTASLQHSDIMDDPHNT